MSEKTLKVMYTDATNAAVAVVNAMNEGKTPKEIKELKKACTAAVDLYNKNLADEYYRQLANDNGMDAVKIAIEYEENRVPKAIGFQFKTNDDGFTILKETEPVVKIDLARMQTVIGKEYFHDDEWFKRVNTLARLIAITLNKELEGSDAFQYAIDEAAQAFDLGADADPKSASSMTKAFQKVVDGILWIGDEKDKKGNPVNGVKFTSRNWAYIREGLTRLGKKNGEIVFVSPYKCLEIVTNSINTILNNIGNKLICD